MKVSVIIVHYKTPWSLSRLTRSIKDPYHQVIVIDNDKKNVGYAAGCNRGVLLAKHKWLLFLNPDIQIQDKQIDQLVEYAEKQRLDACSPHVDNDYRKPLPTPLSLLIEFSPLGKIIPLSVFGKHTLFGGCLLIKTDVLRGIGGWDERFFVWFEDSDLTKRLIDNGYTAGWSDGLNIKHEGGESLKKLPKQTQADIFFHSMDIFAKKHFSKLSQFIIRLLKKRHSHRNVLPKMSSGVSITVPNLKLELLESFFQKNIDYFSQVDEIIAVSSGLNNDSVWEWRRKYPNVRFIPIDINLGFATTANIGFRVSSGEWIGTVNDDIKMTPNWVESCMKCAAENTGSINPLIYTNGKTIESAGIKILMRGKAETIKEVEGLKCKEVDATNGAAVLYGREALNKVGLFDERFGSYLEDIDLSMRIKKAGFKNTVCSTARITHIGHQTSISLGAKKQYLDFKNWFLVIGKNWSIVDILLNFPAIIIERLRNLFGIIKALNDSLQRSFFTRKRK